MTWLFFVVRLAVLFIIKDEKDVLCVCPVVYQIFSSLLTFLHWDIRQNLRWAFDGQVNLPLED